MSKSKDKNKYITDLKDIITNINILIDKNNEKDINKNINKNDEFITHKKKNIFEKNENLHCDTKILLKVENYDINLENNLNLENDKKKLSLNIEESNFENSVKKIRNRSSSLSSSQLSPNEKSSDKKIKDKNIYFNELLKKQITGISSDKRLNYNDIKRISKFIKSSIFDKKKCSVWAGYITNENNNSKGTYINFYFNKKKIALHRLLYINYVGILLDSEYLKFSCDNKGKCCNINHMKKYSYTNKINLDKTQETNEKKNTIDNGNIVPIQINLDKKKLIVEI